MGYPERLERIERAFLHGPGVHPKGFLNHPANGGPRRALVKTLRDLPEEVFSKVVSDVAFVFDCPRTRIAAIALRGTTIVLFREALAMPEPELERLIGHELAHLLLSPGHSEEDADFQAKTWALAGEGHDKD